MYLEKQSKEKCIKLVMAGITQKVNKNLFTLRSLVETDIKRKKNLELK